MTSTIARKFTWGLQPAPAWTAILGLVLITALGLLVHAGGLLRFGFPAGCFLVAVFLYYRYPILYLGFTWWIWFLSPWVRRMADISGGGYVEPSPLLLAPFLTTLVTGLTFLRHIPRNYQRGGLPFLLCFLGVMYSLLVGLVQNPPMAVVVPLLGWLTPLLFGYHLYANWPHYPALRQNLQRVFIWGVLVMGVYGLFQYLTAPACDRFWLENQAGQVFGLPQPLGIRVFSTMNSPQPFAFVMGSGLLLLFSSDSPAKFVAAGTGYLSFLLSLARSAWVGWAVGLALFIPALKARLQMRLIVSLIIMGLLVLPLTTIEPFSTAINSRLQSLTSVNSDVSYNARSEGYNDALGMALQQGLGLGLGSSLASTALGSNDSGILTLLFSLGWLGTLPYLGGLLLLILSLFQGAATRSDAFASAAQAIVLSGFVQIGLNNIMLGVFGIVFWGFLGIAQAAKRYYIHQAAIKQAQV